MAETEEAAEHSRAEKLRVTKEVFQKFKNDGPIKIPPELVSSLTQTLNTKFKLRLCNLERWRLEREQFNTLDFRYINKEITDKYVELEKAMTDYYTYLYKYNVGLLSEKRIVNGMIVAVDLGDGIFRRAIILKTILGSSKNINSLQAYCETQTGYFPKYSLHLLETNTSVWLESQHKLMYMVKQFTQISCQVFQFFLKETEDYHDLIEFRDALCSIVSEEDELEAEGHLVSAEKVMFVTLWSPKLSDPLNQVLREMTISALKKPNLPPVGEIFSAAHLSHIEPDGLVSLQFGSYRFNLFKEVEKTIPKNIFENLSKVGPYNIDTETIYLNFWDFAFYRVKIHAKPVEDDKLVLVHFIDYGNYEHVAISDLVPCVLVSPHFAKFKPQAIRAQLANVASIDLKKLNEMMNFETNPEIYVETYQEATDSDPAVVELLIPERDRRSANIAVDVVATEAESNHAKIVPTNTEQTHDGPQPTKTENSKLQDKLLPTKPENDKQSKPMPTKPENDEPRGKTLPTKPVNSKHQDKPLPTKPESCKHQGKPLPTNPENDKQEKPMPTKLENEKPQGKTPPTKPENNQAKPLPTKPNNSKHQEKPLPTKLENDKLQGKPLPTKPDNSKHQDKPLPTKLENNKPQGKPLPTKPENNKQGKPLPNKAENRHQGKPIEAKTGANKDKPVPTKTINNRNRLLQIKTEPNRKPEPSKNQIPQEGSVPAKNHNPDELLPTKPVCKAEASRNLDKQDEPPFQRKFGGRSREVVVLRIRSDPPFRMGAFALKEKFAQEWQRPMLSPKTSIYRPPNPFPDIEAINWAFPSEIPILLEVGSILDIIVMEVLDISNLVIGPAHAGRLVTDMENKMSNSSLYALTYMEDYENKFHPSIRQKRFVLEKGMYYALYDEASYPEQRYFRVRLMVDPPPVSVSGLDKVEVLLIDYGRSEAVAVWRLFYLEPQFCRVPPQAAILQFCDNPPSEPNPMHIRMLRERFLLQRMLVKVLSFQHGSSTGRCLINGDIYKDFPSGLRVGLAESRTLSAAEAEKIILKSKFQIQKLFDICKKKMKQGIPAANEATSPAAANEATSPAVAAQKATSAEAIQSTAQAAANQAKTPAATARTSLSAPAATVRATASVATTPVGTPAGAGRTTAPVAAARATTPADAARTTAPAEAVRTTAPAATAPVVTPALVAVATPSTAQVVARKAAPTPPVVEQARAQQQPRPQIHQRRRQRRQRQQ